MPDIVTALMISTGAVLGFSGVFVALRQFLRKSTSQRIAFFKRSLSPVLFGVYLFPLYLVWFSATEPPADLLLCGLMFALVGIGLVLSRHDSLIWRLLWTGAMILAAVLGALRVVARIRGLPFLLDVLLLDLVIACVPLAFIVPLSRKRVRWQVWELAGLIFPYGIFAALMFSRLEPKNPLNFFDSVSVSFAIPIAALVRVGVGSGIGERLCAALLVCVLCIAAAAVYFTVPCVHDSM
jgi:hypothetical protein